MVSLKLASTASRLVALLLLAAPTTQLQAQMQAQAQRAALRPMKLDIHTTSQGKTGSPVTGEVVLLDANNQKAHRERATRVQVAITSPSGMVQTQELTIPPGQSAASFGLTAAEPGVVSVRVTDSEHALLPGANSVLINRPVPKTGKKARLRSQSMLLNSPSSRSRFLEVSAGFESMFLIALQPQADDPASDVPRILLSKEAGKDEILADGKDFARIKAFFMDPNGDPAPRDINIWLTWTNGELQPQPLVIRKGEISAEAELISNSPVTAKVTLVAVAPKYEVADGKELSVSFVPPIYGVGTPSPNPLRISLIDAAPLTAQFFDQNGRAIQTDRARKVTFISSNPALHLDPTTRDVQARESGASIFLVPTWSGRSSLDIWTPGYDHQTLTIEVSMWLVLIMCTGGGMVGGIAARDRLKGSVAWRCFVGVLGAIILVWVNVYAVLPRTHSIIAHNLISVFVVGIIGGYGGTGVLDWALKRFTGAKTKAAGA